MFGFSIQSSCTDGPILSLSAISCPIAFISRKTALGPPTLSSLELFFFFHILKPLVPAEGTPALRSENKESHWKCSLSSQSL